MLKPLDDYLANRDKIEADLKPLISVLLSEVNEVGFEIARALNRMHGGSTMLQMLMESKDLSVEAKTEVPPALFYNLFRDG